MIFARNPRLQHSYVGSADATPRRDQYRGGVQEGAAADRLLDGLDPAQRDAVTAPVGPLVVLAGAGSGKTRVLTRRIAYRAAHGTLDPRHVLALTFTRRAAGELRTRLAGLGLHDLPTSGTFHALAYAQLRMWWTTTGRRPPVLLDRKGRLLARILDGRTKPGDVATEIEWARARAITPDGYIDAAAQHGRRLSMPPARVADAYRAYEEAKRRKGLVDFDDLLVHCADAIERDAAFAQAQRWRFRHLFVDEYQDLNGLQHRLLQAWLGERDDICVVGDPNQAIYGWNGADAGYLQRFAQEVPATTVVHLDRNHRSTPAIVATAAAALRDLPPIQATRPEGPLPVLRAAPDDAAEATAVARAVRSRHHPGHPWSEQAVLVRTNAQLAVLERALTRAKIPYRVRGSVPFAELPEVAELVRPLHGSTASLRTWLGDLAASVEAQRQAATAGNDAEDDIAGDSTPAPSPESTRLDLLDALVRLGHDLLEAEPTAPLGALPDWLVNATRADDGDDRRHDAVDLVTFHASKGLEWKVVHVAGLEDGFVPISHARSQAAHDEERRLLYVALTRAHDELYLTWAQQRTFGTRTVARAPSPWLPGIEACLAGQARAARGLAPHERRARLETAREALAAVTEGHQDPNLAPDATRARLRALRAWRRKAARASGVPDTVILSERALHKLAELHPHDADALAAVPGLGRLKAEQYADQLLAVLATPEGVS